MFFETNNDMLVDTKPIELWLVQCGVKKKELAKALNITCTSLSRKLRHRISRKECNRIVAIIQRIGTNKGTYEPSKALKEVNICKL